MIGRLLARGHLWTIDLAGLGVWAGLLAAWYVVGYRPMARASAQREALVREVWRVRQQLDDLTLNLDAHRRVVATLEEQLRGSHVALQPLDHLNRRVGDLGRLAERLGLRVDEVRPGAAVSVGRYLAVPVRLSGSGSFGQCHAFLRTLAAEHPDLGVLGFSLRGEPAAPDKPLTFVVTLAWYAASEAWRVGN